MNQKEAFLQGEADKYFKRNAGKFTVEGDSLLPLLAEVNAYEGRSLNVLEIGCGPGHRLAEMRRQFGWNVFGLEPSPQAVEEALKAGVVAKVGTADRIPWPDKSFDLILYGFCLYLCDLNDLFVIGAEANRSLGDKGWIAILDFYATGYYANPYKHLPGLVSNKMDFSKLFCWHPHYTLFSNKVHSHDQNVFSDLPNEWVSSALIRKCSP